MALTFETATCDDLQQAPTRAEALRKDIDILGRILTGTDHTTNSGGVRPTSPHPSKSCRKNTPRSLAIQSEDDEFETTIHEHTFWLPFSR